MARHSQQYVWPQFRATGEMNSSRQVGHWYWLSRVSSSLERISAFPLSSFTPVRSLLTESTSSSRAAILAALVALSSSVAAFTALSAAIRLGKDKEKKELQNK